MFFSKKKKGYSANTISVYWKYLIGMLFLLFLSIAAMFIINQSLVKHQKENKLEQLELQIEHGCNTLSQQLYSICAIPDAISQTHYYDYISAVKGEELPRKYVSVLSYLRRALNKQLFLFRKGEECVLYFSRSNCIITKKNIYPLAEDCFEQYISFSQLSSQTILDTMRSSFCAQLFPMQDTYFGSDTATRCLPYIIRLHPSSIAVMGLFSEETVLELLNYSVLPEGTYFEITTYDGTIAESYPAAVTEEVLDNSHPLTGKLRELQADITFYIPDSYFQDITVTVQKTGLLVIGFITLLGIFISILLSNIFTRPLYEVILPFMKTEDMPPKHRINEVEYISHILDQANQDKQQLQNLLCRQFLTNAFSGHVLSEKDSQQLTAFLCSKMSPPFRLAIFRINDDDNQLTLISYLHQLLSDTFLIQPFHDTECGILFGDSNIALKKLAETQYQLKTLTTRTGGTVPAVHIGISDVFDKIDQMHIAVRQAYLAMHSENQPGMYVGNVSTSSISWLWHERLYQSILSKDRENTLHLLEDIQKENYYGKVNEQIFYNITFVLQSAASEIEITLPSLESLAYNHHLSSHKNFTCLCDITRELFDALDHKQKSILQTQHAAVLSYLSNHFTDSEICALQVAEHFSLSEKKVYNIVREATGMSFNEYLLKLRMEKASSLLLSTSVSIEEIYQMCGYMAESTFYRVFKKYYHQTPTEYRKCEINPPLV